MNLHQLAKSILIARDGDGTQHPQNLSVEALEQLLTEHQVQRIELELVYEELRRAQSECDELRSAEHRNKRGATPTEKVSEVANSKMTHKPHILIVDDDEPVLTSFKFLLEHLGYLVSDYTNPREAFEAFCVDPSEFALVLIDYNMPGLSGIDMARKLRSIRKDEPIAITSGYINSELRLQAGAVGVHDIIQKPCEVSDLRSIVSRLIGQ